MNDYVFFYKLTYNDGFQSSILAAAINADNIEQAAVEFNKRFDIDIQESPEISHFRLVDIKKL